MKKTLLSIFCIFALGVSMVSAAQNYSSDASVFDKDGNYKFRAELNISGFSVKNDENAKLEIDAEQEGQSTDIPEKVYAACDDYEQFLTFDLKSDNKENPYPEIDEMSVNIYRMGKSGGLSEYLGKNFKLYYIGEESVESVAFTEKSHEVSFKTDKLGRYALYFDEATYDVNFYTGDIGYDEDNEPYEIPYFVAKDLKAADTVVFPAIPSKEDYEFLGWQVQAGGGTVFAEPQPHKVSSHVAYYAAWCKKEEYTPFTVTLSSDEAITKGNEDGALLKLTISDGSFPGDVEGILEENVCVLKGDDSLSISKIERVDEKTVQLTISGNSDDIYSDSKLYVEFSPYWIDFGNESSKKIQLDSDGVMAKIYTSNNKVTVQRQARKSTGGSLSGNKAPESKKYTVTFDTTGGSTVDKMTIEENSSITEPTAPTKEGYTFDGWYTDKELSSKYDFAEKVSGNITLYAKWNEQKSDDTKTDDENKADSKIILTINKKDATVFGESKTNDVAPIIRNDRTMLPARFVAESLGAKVIWDADKKQVTVTGKNNDKDVEIIITIDSDKATVNGETIELDSPAFIENDRTYTPIRFIAEQLGATVEWNEADQTVIINRA